MKTKYILLVLVAFFLWFCKIYIKPTFRNSFSNLQVLDVNNPNVSYFKIHFKNGDVSILDKWQYEKEKDTLYGEGKLFDYNRNPISTGNLAFSGKDIAIVETNMLETIRSRDNDRIAGLAILTGLNVAMVIYCATVPKACFGSCPTFYIEEKNEFMASSAEGFSSSIAPSLEKKDIDALNFSTASPKFSITMKNEALETHMVNQLAVLAVPKDKKEMVFQTKDDHFFKCQSFQKPEKAWKSNPGYEDILPSIVNQDLDEYFSRTDSFELATKEELFFEFDPESKSQLGMVVNFRQTLLTTFLLYTGLGYMGDEFGDYFTMLETNSTARKLFGSPFERLGGIELFVWDEKHNKWVFFDTFKETGPIAKNLMLAPIPQEVKFHRKLKLKMKLTKGHWRVDQVGLVTIKESVEPKVIFPHGINAVSGNKEKPEVLVSDDDQYLYSFPGDEYQIHFELPELSSNEVYELFLMSKGYYLEWMRKEWLVNKDIQKLKKMIKGDPKVWKDLASEFKSIEEEAESVFWSSKYSSTK